MFKTTNHVCEAQYTDEWKGAVQFYTGKSDAADPSSLCRNQLVSMLNNQTLAFNSNSSVPWADASGFTEQMMDRYCRDAIFTEHGASVLNDRLVRFLEQYQMDHGKELSQAGIRLALFPDHDVQPCKFSAGDGRHYFKLVLMRIRLFANLLQCVR